MRRHELRVGGIALVKGQPQPRGREALLRLADEPGGAGDRRPRRHAAIPGQQDVQARPAVPSLKGVRLIKYDFEKHDKAAERKRLIERWQREVEALPR